MVNLRLGKGGLPEIIKFSLGFSSFNDYVLDLAFLQFKGLSLRAI